MNAVISFFKNRAAVYLSILASAVSFAAVFALYGLPLGAAAYGAAVALFFTLVILAVYEIREYKRRRVLKRLIADYDLIGELSGEELFGGEYGELVRMLYDKIKQRETESAQKLSELTDSYTLWTHQIKTPIAAMRLSLQNEDTELSCSLTNQLLKIEEYTDMALCIIRLDGVSDYMIKRQEIDPVIKQAVRRFSAQFIQKRIRLELSPSNIIAVTDEKWLMFVIGQIISNSLKYTYEGGIIKIYSDKNRLYIEDSGIGIDPADLPLIFERGYTGENGRSDKRASGIGLYLCRRICQNLGHEITAYSEKGKGTRVCVAFSDDLSKL